MRIAIVVERYPATFKSYFDAQFVDLVRAGHDIAIYAGGTDGAAPNEKVTRFDLAQRVSHYPMSLRALPALVPELVRHLPRSAVGPARAVRATAGTRARRRITDIARALTIRGDRPELFLIHGLSAAAMVLPWLPRALPGVPIALYYHGGELPTTPPVSDGTAAAIFDMVDVAFTNTSFSRSHAIGRGCPPERMHVLPVGFDLDDYVPPARRAYRPDGTLRMLSAGRMSEEKGFEYALHALRDLARSGMTDVRYHLTGHGYYRERLESFVAQNGLEDMVRFLGTLSTDNVIREMGEADVVLLPSVPVGNWVENQACVVQEAMLMKAVVIVTRTGGVPESVPPAMQPFVCEPGSPRDLAEAIRRVHAMDTGALAQLGEAGRDFVLQHYDIRTLNRRMLEIARSPDRIAVAEGGSV